MPFSIESPTPPLSSSSSSPSKRVNRARSDSLVDPLRRVANVPVLLRPSKAVSPRRPSPVDGSPSVSKRSKQDILFSVKVTSINTRGFSVLKESFIFDHSKSYDICFVQESQISDPNSLPVVGLVVAFGLRLLGGRVGLLPLFLIDLIVRSFLCVRILTVVFLLLYGNSKINVVNINAPTNLSGRKAFFDSLHVEFFFPADFLVIGGDFSCYEHEMDKLWGEVFRLLVI